MDNKVKLWNRNFIMIIIINFLVFMNHVMILSTFPFYIDYLGGSETLAGIAVTLFSFVAVVMRPVIGWLLNNGLRRKILLAGLVGMALMPIGYLLLSVIYLAFICRMLHGASFATSNTTASTIATDMVPKSRFAEGMGMFGLSTALATATAPALGILLMDKMGFTALFVISFGCAGISILLLALMKTPKINVEKEPLRLRSLINKDAIPASLTALVYLFSYGALENFVAKYAAEYSLPSGGLFFAIMAGMVLFSRLTLGKVIDTHGEGIFVYCGNAAMLAALVLLGTSATLPAFVISAVLAGLGFGSLEPALQSMAVAIAPPQSRGSANSTFLCAYDIGIGIGGGIAGSLIDNWGYHPMWLIMIVFNIASVIVYIAIGRNHPSSFRFRVKNR
ncbi:MAG: MFS transporter [Lachnospiraceae bacterium]|nr:MFS transporter [Lachnospiraceae bacterium]